MMQPVLRFTLLAALAAGFGCSQPAPARQDGPNPQPAAAQVGAAVSTAQVVELAAGKVGPLALGMTSQQAVDAYGPPETRYADFLAWKGGQVIARLKADHILTLRLSDPSFSFQGLHVGRELADAKQAFPTGNFVNGEVPVFELPAGSNHAWLELTPSLQGEILAVLLSQQDLPGEQ